MGWVVSATPPPLYPRECPDTPCKEGRVSPTVGLDGCGISRTTPGFEPRTAQPVATRYTNWNIPAQNRPNTHTHTHNEWLLDFICDQETLAYLKDALWRQPTQALKCFRYSYEKRILHTGRDYLLIQHYQLGMLCSTNLHVALFALNRKARGR
jgi:hypothetical protein